MTNSCQKSKILGGHHARFRNKACWKCCVLRKKIHRRVFTLYTKLWISPFDDEVVLPAGVLRISSDGDDRRISLGLKFSIPEFYWVGEFGKYFFMCGSIVGSPRDFFGFDFCPHSIIPVTTNPEYPPPWELCTEWKRTVPKSITHVQSLFAI